eukprot:3635177-Amphidinium_carterae.1
MTCFCSRRAGHPQCVTHCCNIWKTKRRRPPSLAFWQPHSGGCILGDLHVLTLLKKGCHRGPPRYHKAGRAQTRQVHAIGGCICARVVFARTLGCLDSQQVAFVSCYALLLEPSISQAMSMSSSEILASQSSNASAVAGLCVSSPVPFNHLVGISVQNPKDGTNDSRGRN